MLDIIEPPDVIPLIPLFISYRWNETKEQVRQVANFLKSLNRFRVWIDTEEMFGDKNERMEEGIRSSRIVLVFFNDEYQNSRDCRKEAESADRNGKDMIFIKMQRPRVQYAAWFAPIISSNIFIDYYKFEEPAQEILKHIYRVLSGENIVTKSIHWAGKNHKRLVTLKVPKFGKYLEREEDETRILDSIKKVKDESDTYQGAFVVSGGGGIGKTTLVAQVLTNHAEFLQFECGIDVIIWLNCFKWRGDLYNADEFTKTLIELCERAGQFSGSVQLEDAANLFERQNENFLVVLDDVFNVAILETVYHAFQGSSAPSCIVVTRDSAELTAVHGLVSELYRISELDDASICRMFETTYRLAGKLKPEQLTKCAKLCNGLPLIVSLIAARFQDCETSRDILAEYEILVRDVVIKDIKIAGPYGTVSKLFGFSLEQTDEKSRQLYYTFLLFDPAFPVDVEDLAVLWRLSNPHHALVQCRQFAKKSLARQVVTPTSDSYLVHQLLHEVAIDSALETHQMAYSLANLRSRICCQFRLDEVRALLETLCYAMSNFRHALVEIIFDRVEVRLIAAVFRKSSKLTERKPFLLYFYEFEKWPGNGRADSFGYNLSYRLLFQFFKRAIKSNELTSREILNVLVESDEKGNSFLQTTFSQMNRKPYWSDRWRLSDVLKPLAAFKEFFLINWRRDACNRKAKNNDLYVAIVRDIHSARDLKRINNVNVLARDRNGEGEIPLMAAARVGTLEAIEFIWSLYPEGIDVTNNLGRTSLLIASYEGASVNIVDFFYKRTSPASRLLLDTSGKNALLAAVANGNNEIAQYLYEQDKQSLFVSDKMSRNALHFSCRYGHKAITEFVVAMATNHKKFEAMMGSHDKHGMTPLHFAAANGYYEVVECILKDIEDKSRYLFQCDKNGVDALMMAARKGNMEIIEFLYSLEPSRIHHTQNDDRTAFAVAANCNHVQVTLWFYQKDNSLALWRDKERFLALESASRFGHLNVVRALGDAMLRDSLITMRQLLVEWRGLSENDDTVLSSAIRLGYDDVAEYYIGKLLEDDGKNMSVEECRNVLQECLDIASNEKQSELIKLLKKAIAKYK